MSNIEEENNTFVSTRRESIMKVSSAMLTTTAFTFSTTMIRSDVALANDDDISNNNDGGSSSDGGKLIEFIVENINGQPSNTGRIIIKTHPEWSPNGVKRFEKLTEIGFWNDVRIFRVLPNFIAQFGINGDPSTQALWRSNIPDDTVKVGNTRGTVVFATAGPNTRTTQIFINTGNNNFLDKQGFSPIGEVVEGMDVVDKLYSGYGEGAPRGKGPNQGLIQVKGNVYLEKEYPNLSYFSKVKFL